MENDRVFYRTIIQLKGLVFQVPDYQRGYRWKEQEVNDLLEDISEFNYGTAIEPQYYYLQPLVLRKIDENKYELVDGQQRLTTLFLIIKTCLVLTDETEVLDVCPYALDYQTRENSRDYLNNLGDVNNVDASNIDYFYITKAVMTIKKWIKSNNDWHNRAVRLHKTVMSYIRFIWYELPDSVDSGTEFRKINDLKIGLTESELIKALLLNSENYEDATSEVKARRDEISIAWDNMEQHLQQSSFWSFISKDKKDYSRIDVLFEILARKYEQDGISKNVRHFSFLTFYRKIRENQTANARRQVTDEIWRKTEEVYDTMCDWFNDDEKYHLVGYLIHSGLVEGIREVFETCDGKKKTEIVPCLKGRMGNMKAFMDIDSLLNLNYDDPNRKTYQKIKNLLLLFNIASLICTPENQSRFPFDIYNKMSWDVEHIHALRDRLPNTIDDIKLYLSALHNEFKMASNESQGNDKELYSNAANDIEVNVLGVNVENLSSYEKAYNDFITKYPVLIEEDNSIRNLALLDSATNRGYRNSTFRQKRKEIIDYDSKGRFIPICTKNVFLKFYSPDAHHLMRWEKTDRENYMNKIHDMLVAFFGA